MGRVICVSNQKGGVGKTTTAINLAASLAASERRTLLVDMDPQGNAASGVGAEQKEGGKSLYEALVSEAPLRELVRKTGLRFLQVLPGSKDLIGAEVELVGLERREFRLKDFLRRATSGYDYVLVDCPPSLGLLTLNALTAAHSVLIPLQCEYYALEGLSQLLETVELVKQGLNPRLEVEGILLTMVDGRANLSRQVEAEVREHFGQTVFKTVIPRNVRLAESPSFGKPILLYDIRSKGCEAYLSLGSELMAREKLRGQVPVVA